jgi:hypothetical protein
MVEGKFGFALCLLLTWDDEPAVFLFVLVVDFACLLFL